MRPIRSAAALVAAGTAAALVAVPSTVVAQESAPVVETGLSVESFDGTVINTNVFLPGDATQDAPVPLVMRTHGWGGSGETEVGTGTLSKLLDAGYAVVTWDQRGFGQSGGTIEALKPDIEGRDTSAVLDFVVDGYPILADGGDPVVGMSGGSYAGGIQMATSFLDDRIDAIAPEIAWASLVRALYEGDVANLGWAAGLGGLGLATGTAGGLPAGETGTLSPSIVQALGEILATTQIMDGTLEFFLDSGLSTYTQDEQRYGPQPVADGVDVPALVMNGSVDTLFDATGGADIYEHVLSTGQDAKYVVFCGGHVACPADYVDAGDRERMDDLLLEWFAVHLRGEQLDTGPAVEYRTNEGEWRAADGFDATMDRVLTVEGATGSVVQTGLVQPADPSTAIFQAQPNVDDQLTGFTVEVAQAPEGGLELVGIPEVELTVEGLGDHVHLFVKLVHREAGHVLNLQETSLRANGLTDGPVTVGERMAGLAYTVPAGDHLDLQVSTVSLMHQTARIPAQVDVTVDRLTVPVVDGPVAAPDVADGSPAPAPDGGGDPAPAPGAGPGTDPAPAPGAPLPATGGGALALGAIAVLAGARLRRR